MTRERCFIVFDYLMLFILFEMIFISGFFIVFKQIYLVIGGPLFFIVDPNHPILDMGISDFVINNRMLVGLITVVAAAMAYEAME
ncbi:hypothetical protein [uncultured Enterococcus sp.]|uniref:hypothetical protein n=1 Tax=uncultured Enterococcus sp. TaxID=167972 RepID=UPI002AA72C57|nr:hypothetical protein [uncultured Enterococcus sp.]